MAEPKKKRGLEGLAKIDISVMNSLALDVKITWRLMRDPRVPFKTKLIMYAALAYAISPVDLAMLNPFDDLAVIWGARTFFIAGCPPAVVEEITRQVWEESAARQPKPQPQSDSQPPAAPASEAPSADQKASAPKPPTINPDGSIEGEFVQK